MRDMARACLVGVWVIGVVACGPATRSGGGDGGDAVDAGPCTNGETRCEGLVVSTCQGGRFVPGETCELACLEGHCAVCQPGTGTCNGTTSSTACRADGSGFEEVACDPVQGVSCDAATGLCEGACAPKELGADYIGCDYYPTIAANAVSNDYSFAVVAANTTDLTGQLTIEGPTLGAPIVVSIAAQSAVVQRLPWVEALRYQGALARDGAYRVRSTVPITVYQFSPIEYTVGEGMIAASADASLMLPMNAWGTSYRVASWPTQFGTRHSFITVTAAHDQTTVTITPTSDGLAVGGAPALTAGVPTSVVLDQGDVLQVGAVDPGDFTGSLVESDKPMQVIGSQLCADVPEGVSACDHIEESMWPVTALSDRYVVVPPALPVLPNGREEVVRIIATEPNTTLTYDPPQAGAPTTIAAAGGFVEIARQRASYLVSADHKVLVAQYMEGSTADGVEGSYIGDPSLTLAVPVDQFRPSYVFHAPTNYLINGLDVVAEVGVSVELDGVALTGWQPIGASGYAMARMVPLGNGPLGDGNHRITSSRAFGISVYGYGSATSYWYPGGLNLTRIVID